MNVSKPGLAALLLPVLLLVSSGPAGAAVLETVLDLAPGTVRLALPSPDGTRLAVLGGSGDPAREHVVEVLEVDCKADTVRSVMVSRSARYLAAPDSIPAPYLQLQWSPDGSRLFAAGAVYAISSAGDSLRSRLVRRVPKPVFDFRFGPGDRAAGVMVDGARTVEVTRGRRALVISLAYALFPLDRPLVMPIAPREHYGGDWVPADWEGPPAVSFDPDGALLIFYPYHRVTERYLPGKARDAVAGRRPAPPAEAGTGPFRIKGSCVKSWTPEFSGTGDRVRAETR